MAAERRIKGLSKSCFLLIVIAGIERFAFKGVASNLVIYLTDVVKMSNSSAAKMVNSWCGLTSMTPLLVSPLADFYWGRYSTIMASSFLYAVGLVALTSTALEWAWSGPGSTRHSFFLYCSLCLISMGQGGYNPSLQAFGADQLVDDEEIPKNDNKSTNKAVFFQWWYFGVCGGCLLGVTVMSYIQDTIGWVTGFGIPAVSMILSIALFSCGSRIYVYKQHNDFRVKKPSRKAVQYIEESASKVLHCGVCIQPDDRSELHELDVKDDYTLYFARLQEQPLCGEDFSSSKMISESPQNNINMFTNVDVVLLLLPMWLTLLMFAVIFQQPATFFTKQGMTMERSIGGNFKIPPATLQSAITLSIIMLMPLYDTVFIPITRLITRQEKGVSVMQRIGIGIFLSVIAMVIAALVETKRRQVTREKKIADSETIPFSIFWLLPQYILLGISDIFTVVGMQEFFYTEVPVRMRTMGIALYTSVFGVGSFVSALLITTVEFFTSLKGGISWFSDDMSKARLDHYYWLLALLCGFSLLMYMILCRNFKSRCHSEDEN